MNTAPSTAGEKVRVRHYLCICKPCCCHCRAPGNIPKCNPNALHSVPVEHVLEVLQHLAPVVPMPADARSTFLAPARAASHQKVTEFLHTSISEHSKHNTMPSSRT